VLSLDIVAPTFLVGLNTVEETGLFVSVVNLDLAEEGGRDFVGVFVDFPTLIGDAVAFAV
jgi:hypothetical protein